jgi:hypothetical protein
MELGLCGEAVRCAAIQELLQQLMQPEGSLRYSRETSAGPHGPHSGEHSSCPYRNITSL